MDSMLNAEVTDLESAVVMLGDDIASMQKQLSLRYDWNVTQFCVTPVIWNVTQSPWENVKKHLLNHKNVSVDIFGDWARIDC